MEIVGESAEVAAKFVREDADGLVACCRRVC